MQPQEAVELVERIKAWCTSWSPNEKVVIEWAQELMNYSQYESEWVWFYIRELLRSRDSDFAPSLGKVLNAVGIAHSRKVRYTAAALPPPPVEKIDQEEAAARIADIQKIIGDKKIPGKQEPKFEFETKAMPTSDDLEGNDE